MEIDGVVIIMFIVFATIGGAAFCAIILAICSVGTMAKVAKDEADNIKADQYAKAESKAVMAAEKKKYELEVENKHLKDRLTKAEKDNEK